MKIYIKNNEEPIDASQDMVEIDGELYPHCYLDDSDDTTYGPFKSVDEMAKHMANQIRLGDMRPTK